MKGAIYAAIRNTDPHGAPLDRANVDTDQIIPKQFLKRIERTGYGDFLFFDWDDQGPGLRAEPSRATRARRFSSQKRTSAAALPANTRRGRSITTAFAPSSRRASPTSSIPTRARTASSWLRFPTTQVEQLLDPTQSTIDGYKSTVSLEDASITRQRLLDNFRDRSVSPLLPARRPRRHRPDAAPRQPARRV